MSSIVFRQTNSNEFETAYRVICETFDWLKEKNIKQWTEPYPKPEYERRQLNGENYAFFADEAIAVVLSIICDYADNWLEEIKINKKIYWLCTIATSNQHRGREFGRRAITEAVNLMKSRNVNQLYLDCVWENGFLPEYYKSLGFQLINRKVIDWPKCGPQEMALMCYDIVY